MGRYITLLGSQTIVEVNGPIVISSALAVDAVGIENPVGAQAHGSATVPGSGLNGACAAMIQFNPLTASKGLVSSKLYDQNGQLLGSAAGPTNIASSVGAQIYLGTDPAESSHLWYDPANAGLGMNIMCIIGPDTTSGVMEITFSGSKALRQVLARVQNMTATATSFSSAMITAYSAQLDGNGNVTFSVPFTISEA